jgi:hypothetical protein
MRRLIAALLLVATPTLVESGTVTYTGTFKAPALHEALLAAFPGQDIRVESTPDGALVRITVPDTIPKAQVDAVVNAHNPAADSAAEAKARQHEAARGRLRTRTGPVTTADFDDLLSVLGLKP